MRASYDRFPIGRSIDVDVGDRVFMRSHVTHEKPVWGSITGFNRDRHGVIYATIEMDEPLATPGGRGVLTMVVKSGFYILGHEKARTTPS